MNKKFLSAILFGALMVTSTGTFVSCKDYDDDIEDLRAMIEAQKSDLSTQLSALQSALTTVNTEIAAAKQAAATAQAAADKAAEQAALAKEAAATAKKEAIEEATKLVNDLKTAVDGKVDKATYDAKVLELGSQIASIETGLNKITPTVNGHTQAIATLQTQMKAVEAYKALIEKKADATEITRLEGLISTIQEDMKSIATTSALKEVEKKVEAIRVQVAAIQEDLVTILSKELRSLVFVPNLYVDGIEATEYAFGLGTVLGGLASDGNIKGQDDDNTPYTITKDAIYDYASGLMDWNYNPTLTINYHLNPSSAEVKTEDLSFVSRDVESITSRAANDSKAVPAVVGSSIKDGILTVSYRANGEAISTAEKVVSIMALQAEIKRSEKEDTTITSDYASLYPSRVMPVAIAYSQDIEAIDCLNPQNAKSEHIYRTAKDAIENVATIKVEFNGSVELKDYLNIHYNQSNAALGLNDTKSAGEHKIWNYGEEALYDLEYKYSLVEYTVGSAQGTQTEEHKYGYVDAAGHFEPRYVDADGNSVASDGTSGVSSIGKKPVVRVEVVDKTTGDVVLGGFVKLEIVRTIAPVEARPFDLGKLGYACNWMNKSVTWAQMSSQLLELAAATSKAEFEQLYELDKTYYNTSEQPDGSNNEWYAFVYTKVNGKFVRINTLKEYNYSNFFFGFIEEYGNVQGVANDRIQWSTYQYQRDNIYDQPDNKATVYVCYKPKASVGESAKAKIYVPLTMEVVKPIATYGDKIAEYWYENNETQRLNVLFPKDNENTEDYTVNMNNAFVNNAVKFTITNNEDGIFTNKNGSTNNWVTVNPDNSTTTNVGYVYYFTEGNNGRQYVVDGETYTLAAAADGNTLYAVDKNGAYHTIATLNDLNGNFEKMKYAGAKAPAANTVAKKLLNAWAHDAETSYFANVGIRAYNGCDIILGEYGFNARFLRPIDVEDKGTGKFTDAEANGSVLDIMDVLAFSDWRDIDFTGANGWLYAFYDVKSVVANIDGITTTMNGGTLGTTLLSSVTNNVKFSQTVNGSMNLAAYNKASEATNCLKAVKTAMGKIKYENNGNNVKEFMVRIPVKVTYEWGTITTYVDCKVVNTLGN